MIVDTHVHCSQPSSAERPWDSSFDPKKLAGRPWPVQDMLDEMSAAGVDRIVQVTPGLMGWDNRYSSEIAVQSEGVAAAFARFDLATGGIAERLRQLMTLPGLTGVRITPMTPAEQAWFRDGTLDEFFTAAALYSPLVAFYAPHAVGEVVSLAQRHPNVHILVDHMLLFHADAEPFSQWKEILGMASTPNLSMKMSNFPEVARDPFPYVSVHARIREAYEAFGPDRLMWGSNFPNCQRACTLKEAAGYLDALDFLTDADRRKIGGESFLAVMNKLKGARSS
jgi:predicted TIM-barrel fold metal-dependent hydrolase